MLNLQLQNPNNYKQYFDGYTSGDIYSIIIPVGDTPREVGVVLMRSVDSESIDMHLHLYKHCRSIRCIRGFLNHFKELLLGHMKSINKTRVVTGCPYEDAQTKRLFKVLGFKTQDICYAELQTGDKDGS